MVLDGLRKAIGKLANRNPVRQPGWGSELYPFLLTASQANKVSTVGWSTYYQAMDQEWVSSCITAIVSEVLGCGFDIEHRDETKQANETNKAYITDLFQYPAGPESRDTYTRLMWKSWGSFLGTGDTFIEVAYNEATKNIPAGLYFIPPHKLQWFTDTAQWGYVGGKTRFETEELIHVSKPDPWDDIWGKSPIDSIARSLTLDILAWQFNRDFFKSGIHPRGIFKYDPTVVSQEAYDKNTATMEATMQNNPRGNLFMYGGEYVDIGLSNKDMEFSALTDRVRDRILGVYGVPPHKVGIIESGNLGGGTGESQDLNFWKKRKGEIKLFEDGFNNVLGRTGWDEIFRFGEVDLENKKLRAETEDIRIKNNSSKINDVRAGYGEEPVEWGDTPFSLLVAGTPPVVAPTEQGVKRWMKTKGLYVE